MSCTYRRQSPEDQFAWPVVEFEFVPSLEEPEAIYVVVDGVRAAQRQDRKWVSLMWGVKVTDTRKGIEVQFTNTAIH